MAGFSRNRSGDGGEGRGFSVGEWLRVLKV